MVNILCDLRKFQQGWLIMNASNGLNSVLWAKHDYDNLWVSCNINACLQWGFPAQTNSGPCHISPSSSAKIDKLQSLKTAEHCWVKYPHILNIPYSHIAERIWTIWFSPLAHLYNKMLANVHLTTLTTSCQPIRKLLWGMFNQLWVSANL